MVEQLDRHDHFARYAKAYIQRLGHLVSVRLTGRIRHNGVAERMRASGGVVDRELFVTICAAATGKGDTHPIPRCHRMTCRPTWQME